MKILCLTIIAAKLLLNDGGTGYLVHIADTVEQAKRLQKILKSQSNGSKDVELRSLNDYESDACYIQTEIRGSLKIKPNPVLGLRIRMHN